MKHLSKLLLLSSMLVAVFVSCKKDENKVYLEASTNPVLTSTASGSIPLSYANKDNTALTLTWTNPDYKFTTGTSSQNVNYLIEIDKQGANFNGSGKQTVAVSNDLSRTFTQGEFNDYLLNQLVLDTSVAANIQVRVKASLANGAATVISNTINYTVVPYAIPPKVAPPPSGKLFITGGATPASWQCGCGEAELASQKFNKITNTLYELPSIALTGGQSYLFIPVYGSWNDKYGFTGANNQNNVNGDDFKYNGGDLLAPPSGNYKIQVDFQRGKFTLTRL